MKQPLSHTISRALLAGAVLFTHVMFAHQAEANFWAQRAEAVQRMRSEASPTSVGTRGLADMLSAPANTELLTNGVGRPRPAFSVQSFPAPPPKGGGGPPDRPSPPTPPFVPLRTRARDLPW